MFSSVFFWARARCFAFVVCLGPIASGCVGEVGAISFGTGVESAPSDASSGDTSAWDVGSADRVQEAGATDTVVPDGSSRDAPPSDARSDDAAVPDARSSSDAPPSDARSDGAPGCNPPVLTYASFGMMFISDYCSSCHTFDQSYVQLSGTSLSSVVTSGRMPPGSNPPTSQQRMQFAAWIACGAP